ncbi:MAG TPA: AMP-binding protein [bacterium]|nr:AMP-binding protein [bacterium]
MNDFKIIELTLSELIDKQAELYPNNEALVFADRDFRLTYKEFKTEVDKLAKGLMAIGVRRGEHIALWAQNVPHWIIFMFAIAKIGAVLLTINTAYKKNELKYVLQQSDATTLILTEGLKQNDFLNIVYELIPELKVQPRGYLDSAEFPRLKNVIFIGQEKHRGMYNINELSALGENTISDEEYIARQKLNKPDEVVNMQYTSGTTGFPKGVMLTHINILNNGYYIGENMKYTHKDRLCLTVPLFHCFGCVLGVMAVFTHGATIIPLETFNPVAALATVHKERCTAIYGVPTMFIAELNSPMFEIFDLTSLRTGIMAGSVCPVSVMRAVINKMHCSQLTIVYGLTEASPGITQSSVDDPAEIRAATVGKCLPGVEVKIINPDTLEELGDNQSGELCCRGYNVMKGYYKMPEETAKVFLPGGWLRTGDLATRDENGYFRITGRSKDIIIRGGENISPKEIEDLIYTINGVKDVQVVAAPSEKYGEEVAAFIIKKPEFDLTESDVKDYCRERIAKFKVPKYVFFIDEFPTTANGKIQKYKLRELAIQLISK